eukprot:SAG31_NODE_7958_length_1555_cov_1.227335_1_plen_249_part_00
MTVLSSAASSAELHELTLNVAVPTERRRHALEDSAARDSSRVQNSLVRVDGDQAPHSRSGRRDRLARAANRCGCIVTCGSWISIGLRPARDEATWTPTKSILLISGQSTARGSHCAGQWWPQSSEQGSPRFPRTIPRMPFQSCGSLTPSCSQRPLQAQVICKSSNVARGTGFGNLVPSRDAGPLSKGPDASMSPGTKLVGSSSTIGWQPTAEVPCSSLVIHCGYFVTAEAAAAMENYNKDRNQAAHGR